MRNFSLVKLLFKIGFIKSFWSKINSFKIFKRMDSVSTENTLSTLDLSDNYKDILNYHLLRELSGQKRLFITIPNDKDGIELFNQINKVCRSLEKRITVVFAESSSENENIIDSFSEFKSIEFTKVNVFVMMTCQILDPEKQSKAINKMNNFYNNFNNIVKGQEYVTSALFFLDQSSPFDKILEIMDNTTKRKLNPRFNTNYIVLKTDRSWESFYQDRKQNEKVIDNIPYSLSRNLDKFNLILD